MQQVSIKLFSWQFHPSTQQTTSGSALAQQRIVLSLCLTIGGPGLNPALTPMVGRSASVPGGLGCFSGT